MAWECAVEPDGTGAVDSDGKDGIIHGTGGREAAAEEASIVCERLTRGREGCLGDGVSLWVELELNDAAYICSDAVWREGDVSTLANCYGLNACGCGGC